MYTLRNIARRGTMLAGAGALAFASLASGSAAFADALNPLTHRSLTLSSSSPGWAFTDGSENGTYAPPNSGANGKKTGNTFSFDVSTDSSSSNTIQGLSFQYCTKSAGICLAPGNNDFDTSGGAGSYTRNPDSVTNRTSDLNVAVGTAAHAPSELSSAQFSSKIDATSGLPTAIPAADDTEGTFIVLKKDIGDANWSQSAGWTFAATPNDDGGTVGAGTSTGANNYITLANSGGGLSLHPGGAVKVIFFATDNNYITNPGAGAFFVKINDYNTATTTSFDAAHLVDGGVTVANVMNQSIQITTKVLETMDFSVGTVDPDTLNSKDGGASTQSQLEIAEGVAADNNATLHGPCDNILMGMDKTDVAGQNVLQLGDTTSESSLSTAHTYSTHSYWRLSSNSSAGATVYYSGVTLSNTVGNQITAIGPTSAAPHVGEEQFGLALTDGTVAANPSPAAGSFQVDYGNELSLGFENAADNTATAGVDSSTTTDAGGNASYHVPQLYPMQPYADGSGGSNYDSGAGTVNQNGANSVDTKFAFDTTSNQIPTPIASESDHVVDCVTGRMRYIANIAATTPAGIYTTKINYIAAPQY